MTILTQFTFRQFYRGRGHSKTSWFVPSIRCGRLSLHVLGSSFLMTDPRQVRGDTLAQLRVSVLEYTSPPSPFVQDDYRGKDGLISDGEKRKDRAENTAHMESFTARLQSEWTCVQPGSGSAAYSPDAECYFTKHPDPSMVGRGDDRVASLSSKAIAQVRTV
jgi:hypothetical protein